MRRCCGIKLNSRVGHNSFNFGVKVLFKLMDSHFMIQMAIQVRGRRFLSWSEKKMAEVGFG